MFCQTPQDLEELTIRQQARVRYHGLGFRKAQLDPDIYALLLNHFKNLSMHTTNFSFDDDRKYLHTLDSHVVPSLLYEDQAFNADLITTLRPLHEQWCGLPLINASCYGVRVYQRGSYLYSHVDTIDTHVISSSICIDSQLDKPWPFYIEDIHGQAHEISMSPGDILFYESAKLKHARPYPLEGDYYASMFVHYTPVGWTVAA